MIRIKQLSPKQIEIYNAKCPDGLIQPEYLEKHLPGIKIEDFIEIQSTNLYLKQHPKLPIPCLCYSAVSYVEISFFHPTSTRA